MDPMMMIKLHRRVYTNRVIQRLVQSSSSDPMNNEVEPDDMINVEIS